MSFRIIAENHVRELRRYFHVQVFDEKTVAVVIPVAKLSSRAIFFLQPYFYPMQMYEKRLIAKIGKPERLIGVDVADSDHITPYAARLASYATAMIVPSNFSRNSYISSGVEVPVYVVPHGVPGSLLDPTPSKTRRFKDLYEYKERRGVKLIQVWVLHSEYRKGLDIAYEVFNQLAREREDVALVLRTGFKLSVFDSQVDPGKPEPSLDVYTSWLTEEEIKELMDVCDIYLLSSRGGGFEHPPLLALARGEPVIGARGGAWEDYLPGWSLVPSHRSDVIFKGNPIHDGCGVEMEVEHAVDRLCDILDNMDEYRARVRHHIDTCVKQRFTWRRIGEMLKDIVLSHVY